MSRRPPVYHHHPHTKSNFEDTQLDPGEQTRKVMEKLRRVLQAAGGHLTDIVQLFRFICDIDRNQDAINNVMGEFLGITGQPAQLLRLPDWKRTTDWSWIWLMRPWSQPDPDAASGCCQPFAISPG
jgi:hypothetical protein